MRDELEAPFLDEWLRDTEVTPPDPQEGARRVASQLSYTRQAGRWLPFSLSLRGTPSPGPRPTTTDLIEYQPSPIPATNGHMPTVIGRTHSMLSPAKAITAGAIVFAIGGTLLIAQPFDQQSSGPGAATDSELMRPAPVSGSFTAFGSSQLMITMDASDPRLQVTGVYSAETSEGSDGSDAGLGGVILSTWELANDEGGWIGTGAEIDIDYEATVLELDGLGAYDGLTASLLMQWRESGFSFVGAIVPSELFPAPEATASQ